MAGLGLLLPNTYRSNDSFPARSNGQNSTSISVLCGASGVWEIMFSALWLCSPLRERHYSPLQTPSCRLTRQELRPSCLYKPAEP